MAPFSKIREMARNYMNVQASQSENLPPEDYLQQEHENINSTEANSSSSVSNKTKNPNMAPRGRNKCKKAVQLEVGKKLKVTFYEGRVVGENANEFTRYIGKIVCNPHLCPTRVHNWEDFGDDRANHMFAVLEEKFESDDMEKERVSTIEHMKELWRKWRGKLFQDHVKNLSLDLAIKNVPKNMDKNDWEWLVRVHYFSESYKKTGGQNSENRSGVHMPHCTGSKPFRQIKYNMGANIGNPPSFEKFWFDTCKAGNILDKPETEEKYAKIKKTIEENPRMDVLDVIEECFGRQNKGRVVGYGGSVKPRDLRGPLPSRYDLEMKLKQAEKANQELLGRLEDVENQNRSLSTRLNDVEERFDGKIQAILNAFSN